MRVVLHGGFHKTATSYLQGLLRRNRGYLARNDVMYLHHRDVRKQFTVPCQINAYEKIGVDRKTKIPDAELRKMTYAFFEPVREVNPDTLIISDENMAGHCGHCVQRGMLYHFRRAFMRSFANELPYDVSEIYLSVRNYGDFFAAAYGEYLRSATAFRFVEEDAMKQRLLDRMPSWHLALTAVATAFPEAEIKVWKYEDFGKVSGKVLQSMCGDTVSIGHFKHPKSRNIRPSPSQNAMSKFVDLYKSESPEFALLKRQQLEVKFPKNGQNPSYSPWNEEEYTKLMLAYENHWDRICTNPRFTIIQPNT